jgi:hypothetical protein
MSLVDLKSDLSKYRSEVSKEGKNTPDASSATSDKNFATQQPITDELYKDVPKIKKPKVVSLTSQLSKTKLDDIKNPKPSDVTKRLGTTNLDNTKKPNSIDLVSKLESSNLDDIVIPSDKRVQLEDRLPLTKFDDIVQLPIESVLVNSISELSPSIGEAISPLASGIGLDQIESRFSNINQTRFTSRLNESDTPINPTNPGENNNRSDTEINIPQQTFEREDTSPDIFKNTNDSSDNIVNPDIDINVPEQSFNREDQAVAINKNILSPIGNITNPQIVITRPQQFFDRTENTVNISKNVNDAVDNITIPDIEPIIPPLSFSRVEQSPNIITDTIQEGIVVNPDTTVLRIDQGTIHSEGISEFNIDSTPIRFVGTSELATMIETDDKGPIRYSGQTIHDVDRSQLNLDGITPTIPGGRLENPEDSLYSALGLQEVNFFSNQFALGFNQRQQLGDSKYIGFSQFVWTGGSDDGPFTNAFADTNGRGFQTFVDPAESLFQPNTSQFDFSKITGVNFFDGNNNNTLGGFTIFTQPQITEYKTETSFLGWQGNRLGAPTVNYFDVGFLNTTSGFTKFASQGQSKYIPDSSIFDYDGNKQQAPFVNYFDQSGTVSTAGFHNFAGFMDSKYVLDASRFTFVGNSIENAPSVNYLDQFKQFTSEGFHPFAQKFDTKYIKNSSQFVWSGNRVNAKTINYFDLVTTINSTDGFHSFAELYDTKYVTDSSRFTWVGVKEDAPFVNYLDISTQNVLSGFDTFVPFLESKYKKESSVFTWNTVKQDSPATNYFDLQNQFTTVGFHTFHALNDSKYIKDSSRFDFDGNKQQAPAVNYFDLLNKFTSVGFHTFPVFKESKYIKDSSEFDWDGARSESPAINYFDLQKTHTTTGFHTFAQEYDSKYVKESSRFDWDGGRQSAPAVNYFDLPANFTNTGFHTFAQIRDTKYIPESSEFDWNGKRGDSPEVNFFDINKKVTSAGFHRLAEIYDSKYVEEISIFDWDGSRDESPQVNYFDLRGKFTTIGFHRLAEIYDSKYVEDSSEFTFPGKFPKAGTDYFDKEKLNQTGFTLNIQPKGTSKPAGTEYFHESSFYTFKGGRPGEPIESVINFFQDTNQTGFTMDIKRNEGLPGTEYATESSIFVFKGGRPGLQSFFPDDNQTGFTLDIMAKGSSRPGTEYETDSSEYGFKANSRPPKLDYFPNDNQTGFTLDIMPKGAGNPQTEYINETSRFGFIGLRPTGINYFPDDNQAGFTIDIMRKGSSRPQTEYSTESSTFDWNGKRADAPSNNYFGLYRTPTGKQYLDVQQKNNTTQAGRGFQTFYTDKTVTNYATGYSILSTESGQNKLSVIGASDKPVTNFFGFTPIQRAGFMPSMTLNDGTLYPIINPTLTYNLDLSGRLTLATTRASSGVNTVRGEEFAPLSLGKRPWARNGTLASLENQVPNITLNDTYGQYRTTLPKTAGAYNKKYERTMKDNQLDGSYLASYSINNKQLDLQYKKLQIVPGSTQGSGLRIDPFILRGIQVKDSAKNNLWGNILAVSGSAITFNAGGGFSDQFSEINKADEQRIKTWLESGKGQRWVKLQDQLYGNNPLVDTLNGWDTPSGLDAPQAKTRMYNQSSLLKSIEDNTNRNRSELRIRHGDSVDVLDNKAPFDAYEYVVNRMNTADTGDKESVMSFPRRAANGDGLYSSVIKNVANIYSAYKYNRLIALMAEMLPGSFIPMNASIDSTVRSAIDKKREDGEIHRLSGKGGPNSGTTSNGTTIIRRASHPFMKFYDTSGVSFRPNYPSTAKFETWFGPKTTISGDEVVDNTYGSKLNENYNSSGNTFDGVLTALSYLIENGPKFSGKESQTVPSGSSGPYVQPKVVNLLNSRTTFDPNYISILDRGRANVAGDIDGTGQPTTQPVKTKSIVSEPPAGEDDAIANPIKQYSTLAYNKLKKVARGDGARSHDYNDFRSDIEGEKYKKFSTDPTIADYKANNLEKKFGFGNPGKVGVDRSKPYKSNIKYSDGKAVKKQGDEYEFRGDRINIVDFKRLKSGRITEDFVYETGPNSNNDLPGTKDLITFYFQTVNLNGGGAANGSNAAEAIVFRATFDSITDNHKPSWNPQMYMGSGNPVYLYGSYERDVSFGFTVHIGSRDEQAAVWRKLNYLASWTAPDYRVGRLRAPLCRLNIGHLFRKTPGFINSLTYTFDNVGSTWETAQLAEDKNYGNELIKPGVLQLPKTIQVAVGFTVIGQYRPEFGGIMYNLYEDDGNGLMPTINSNDSVVNFFRTNDTGPKDYDPSADTPLQDFESIGSDKPTAEEIEQLKKAGFTVTEEEVDDVDPATGKKIKVKVAKVTKDKPTGLDALHAKQAADEQTERAAAEQKVKDDEAKAAADAAAAAGSKVPP